MTPDQQKYVAARRATLAQNLRIYPRGGLPPQDQIIATLIEIIDQQEAQIKQLAYSAQEVKNG